MNNANLTLYEKSNHSKGKNWLFFHKITAESERLVAQIKSL